MHLTPLAATQGMPLDRLALVAREACIPGSHGTVNKQRQYLAGYHPQGTAQTAE